MRTGDTAALLSLSLAQFTTTLEFTVMFVALPGIGADLSLTPSSLPWVSSAYSVVFAGFLLLGGRLADRLGARRLFFAALGLFGIASLAGTLAPSGGLVFAARAGQGLAAALLQPALLALLQRTFPIEPARGRAWGVWGALGAVGLAAGALLGGALTTISWRLTFAINIPLLLLCFVGGLRRLAPDDQRVSSRLPLLAALLAVGMTASLTLGLTIASADGWGSLVVWILLASGTALAYVFARHERTPHALIDLALRGLPPVRLGIGVTALYMGSVGSAYYVLTLLFQTSWQYHPLTAGLAFLPLAGSVAVGSALAGRAVRAWGHIRVLATGFGLGLAGLGWLAATSSSGDYPLLVGGLVISGAGNGLIFTASPWPS